MAAVFERWNKGELESYLIQITAKALAQRDPDSGQPIVELILDKAGQKGTGQWTLINAATRTRWSISTINAAVEARVLSSQKRQRIAASRVLKRAAGVDRLAARNAHRESARRTLRVEGGQLRTGPGPDAHDE